MRSNFSLSVLLATLVVFPISSCGDSGPTESASAGVKLVQNATSSGLPTVVEFGAASCASCREMKIVLDRVALRTQGRAHVLVIDISKDWEVAKTFRIQLMPTQVFFGTDGREIGRHMGKLPESEVVAKLGLPATP